MTIQEISIENIHPYDNNIKIHKRKQIENVAESIRQYGYVQPICINKNGIIIIGHCRYEASKLLGLRQVPCVVLDLTEYEERKLRVLDNKLNESEWDFEALDLELASGQDDLEFDGFDIDFIFPQEPKKKEPTTEISNVALEIYNKAQILQDTQALCEWIKDTYLGGIDL